MYVWSAKFRRMGIKINKGDSSETRKAKKSFKRTLSSKKRKGTYNPIESSSEVIRGGKTKSINYTNKYIQIFCDENNISTWGKRKQIAIQLDDSFSLFENANEVLIKLLELLYNANEYQNTPTIRVKGRISFGALYLIDNLCWEIGKKRLWSIQFKDMDESDKAILSKLRYLHSKDNSVYQDDISYMINEKVEINRNILPMAKQKYNEKAKDITDMVIQGMKDNNDLKFELSPDAYLAISSTICEHFDNIYEHVPLAENAYLCGFYNKDLKQITVLIFNFGITIKESFDHKALPQEIKKEINSVMENHTKRQWLGLKTGFTEENAITLLALQEGVSSKLEYDASRGFGIMNYIEHCFNLNKGCKITLISGRTVIKIDEKYSVSEKFFIDRKRKIIAFNETNNIYDKPDKDYVKNIAIYFPGVIIETSIPLC